MAGVGIGIGLGLNRRHGANQTAAAIDKLRRWLAETGVDTRLDALWLTCVPGATYPYVNIIDPTKYPLTASGSVRSYPGQGISGDGAAAYFDTGYDPSLVNLFALSDAHLGVYCVSQSLGGSDFGSWAGAGSTSAYITAMTTGRLRTGSINAAPSGSSPITPATRLLSVAHVLVTRSGSEQKLIEDGVVVSTTAAAAATTVPVGTVYLGALRQINTSLASQWSSRVYSAVHIGASLSDQQAADLSEGLRVFFRSIAGGDPLAIISDGNSLSTSTGSGGSFPEMLALNTGYAVVLKGVASQTTQQMTADAATDIDPYAALPHIRPVVVAWEIRNDLYVNSVTTAAAYDNFKTYCAGRRAAGFKIVAVTLSASTAGGTWDEAARLQINGWMRAEAAGAYWDALADVGADPAFQNSSDPTYYTDGVHNTGAAKAIIATLVQAAIASIAW